MQVEKIFKKILIWLPSLVITIFFISNAIEKIFQFNQIDKNRSYDVLFIIIGINLLVGTAFFLYDKTMILGTIMLACYMTGVIFVHMYKEEPFSVTILIVISTIFAAHLRKTTITS